MDKNILWSGVKLKSCLLITLYQAKHNFKRDKVEEGFLDNFSITVYITLC